jgi:hypothetical protein
MILVNIPTAKKVSRNPADFFGFKVLKNRHFPKVPENRHFPKGLFKSLAIAVTWTLHYTLQKSSKTATFQKVGSSL